MIVDANILLYAVDTSSPHHRQAEQWLTAALRGQRRVGIPWQSIGTFLRVCTHPRIGNSPLRADQAQAFVDTWLATPSAWIPPTSQSTVRIYGDLARAHNIVGNLVPDAQLAALAIEHGVEIVSADGDFARFSEVRWVNPLSLA